MEALYISVSIEYYLRHSKLPSIVKLKIRTFRGTIYKLSLITNKFEALFLKVPPNINIGGSFGKCL